MAVRYVTDVNGDRVAVLFDLEEYTALADRLEGLEDTAEYDNARESPGDFLPVDQAFSAIERERRRLGL